MTNQTHVTWFLPSLTRYMQITRLRLNHEVMICGEPGRQTGRMLRSWWVPAACPVCRWGSPAPQVTPLYLDLTAVASTGPATSPPTALIHSHWAASDLFVSPQDCPSNSLPQGLATCYSLYLRRSCPRYSHGSLPHFFHSSAQTSPLYIRAHIST